MPRAMRGRNTILSHASQHGPTICVLHKNPLSTSMLGYPRHPYLVLSCESPRNMIRKWLGYLTAHILVNTNHDGSWVAGPVRSIYPRLAFPAPEILRLRRASSRGASPRGWTRKSAGTYLDRPSEL